MVSHIDLDELQIDARAILRQVRDEGITIDIADQGEVIARIIPRQPRQRLTNEEVERRFAALDELAAEIAMYWPKGLSAADAVRDDRRDR